VWAVLPDGAPPLPHPGNIVSSQHQCQSHNGNTDNLFFIFFSFRRLSFRQSQMLLFLTLHLPLSSYRVAGIERENKMKMCLHTPSESDENVHCDIMSACYLHIGSSSVRWLMGPIFGNGPFVTTWAVFYLGIGLVNSYETADAVSLFTAHLCRLAQNQLNVQFGSSTTVMILSGSRLPAFWMACTNQFTAP